MYCATFNCVHVYVCMSLHLQPVPSPAPPTPLLPASPATCGIGSPAQQPLMTPEDNEAYLRKLNELQRYTPLLSKWITRLSQSQGENRRGDQIVRLKSLYNLLNNEQRRVPLATLMKCEAALVKMFDQSKEKESHDAAQNAQSAQVSDTKTLYPLLVVPIFTRDFDSDIIDREIFAIKIFR